MGTVILDSSIVIGVLDPHDVHHAAAASLVSQVRHDTQRVLVPVSVLAEVLVAANKQGAEQVRTVERFIDAIADEVVVTDRPIAKVAAALRATNPGIRLPDALVIATGQVRAVDEIYTADKRWRSVDARVRVVEPG